MAGAKNPILNPVGRIASNPIANPLIGQKLNRDINSWVYDDAAQAIPSQTVSAQ
jgi:hypothetical protein